MQDVSDALAIAPDDEALASWQITDGTQLAGRYTVRAKLGDGAVASVYLADDDLGGAPVALKIFDPLRGPDPVGRLRFRQEFEVLSRIGHPGVARCLRLEREGDLDILVLEHLPGETLRERLSRGRLPVAEAVELARSLARALAACHAAGVLHRDLKPDNVVLHPERGPVILDFGVAWFSSALNLTRTGAVVGSPRYIAPEVFASSAMTDARADLYALGVILFEMLSGRPVHLAESVAELAVAHLSGEPPSVAGLRTEVGKDLDAIVARAIAPRPEDRFATAGELADALERRELRIGRALRSRLPCGRCRTAGIIDLPFCPGCGQDVAWDLRPGPYAVQIVDFEGAEDEGRWAASIAATASWLGERHAGALAERPGWVVQRLFHLPVPLIVGASQATAERLVAEARDAGCKAEIVRARALTGPRLRAAAASVREAAVTALLHLAVVVFAVNVLARLGAGFVVLGLLPPAVGVLGVGAAWLYVRRPLLRCRRGSVASLELRGIQGSTCDPTPGRIRNTPRGRGSTHGARSGAAGQVSAGRIEALRERLRALEGDRARRLAASAFARATPALVGDVAGLPSGGVDDVLDALERAVTAAAALDVHAAYLLARPRARLAADLEAARAQAMKGEEGALERLAALEAERDELTETSVAHDLAAREALEACEAITQVLAARTVDVS